MLVLGYVTVSSILEIIHSSSFDLKDFKKKGTRTKDCGTCVWKTSYSKRAGRVHTTSNHMQSRYHRTASEEASFASMHDELIFRPDEVEKDGSWKEQRITGTICKWLYNSVTQKVMSSTKVKVFWIGSSEKWLKSLVRFVQGLSEKIATTLQCRGFVLYPVNIVLMNFPPSCRCCLVENVLTFLWFIVVKVEDEKRIENREKTDKHTRQSGSQEQMKNS